MKIASHVKLVILTAVLTASGAHSQDVVNSPTPAWGSINGQIYDLQSLPLIKLPPDFSYVTYGYSGVPKQPVLLQGFLQGNPPKSVTFKNFPFDPSDFSPVHGVTGLLLSHSLQCRALKTSDVTNWNVLGQPTSVDTVYDCGAP